MTKPLFEDLSYQPEAAAECSPAMQAWLAKLRKAPPADFSAETVAGALALAAKGAARNQKGAQ